MISHLLTSFVSVFHPKEGITSELTGWLFIAPVVVSLVEFLDCDFLVSSVELLDVFSKYIF